MSAQTTTAFQPFYRQLMESAKMDEEGLFVLLQRDLDSKLEAYAKGELVLPSFAGREYNGFFRCELGDLGLFRCEGGGLTENTFFMVEEMPIFGYIRGVLGNGTTEEERMEMMEVEGRFKDYIFGEAEKDGRVYLGVEPLEIPRGVPSILKYDATFGREGDHAYGIRGVLKEE